MLRNIESKIEDIDHTTNNTQPVFASKFTTASISIRYEYIYNLNKKRDKPYMTSLGFGLNPYFTQNNYSTSITTVFPISEKFVGLKGFITPRFTYLLSSKVYIDVNIPLCFFDSYYHADKEDNPAMPISERTIHAYEFSSFPTIFSGRIGIGIKI